MNDVSKPFNFGSFVPGFDFLKNLAGGGGTSSAGAVPGLPGLASWVAPTLSVEEVDKRIQELKTVQFWLEQNLTALKATIQALEVQKMTLSTLQGMNVRMEDLANAFTRAATVASAPAASAAATATPSTPSTPPPAPAPQPQPKDEKQAKPDEAPPAAAAAGVVDPLQWWGALTQQFEQIASGALRDAASLKVPSMLQTAADQATKAVRETVTAAAGTIGASHAKAARTTRKTAASTSRKPAGKRAAPRRPGSGKP